MAQGKFKLKLNTGQASTPNAKLSIDPTPTPSTAIKLNFGKTALSTSDSATPKSTAKRSKLSTSKKRSHDDVNSTATAAASKKIKPTIVRLKSGSHPAGPVRKGSIIKLKKSDIGAASPSAPGIRPALKIKHKGRIPPRPAGVGYDSECSDAEEDPVIEENFILRMPPGPDADYIRKAIEERKLGVPVRDGGADASLRFFTRDARRACVRVQDRFYGAIMVDLPCIVESMKSWDKKGWWKVADVCQMLLVTGRVLNEDAARTIPIPKEVDEKTWAYPHGLTPPMWDVRRRRFRKRASHRTIEQAEEEVERLLEEDAKAKERGGGVRSELLTWEELRGEEEGDVEDEYEDEELVEDAEGDFDDEDDFMADLQAALGKGEETDDAKGHPAHTDSATPTATITAERSGSAILSEEMAIESAEESQEIEEEVEMDGSGSGSSDGDDDDDDDDDDDEVSDEDISEEARERREQMAQQKEEIAHLERQIAEKKKQLDETSNPLLRGRIMNTIRKFEEDRDVKKRGIGMGVGDDEDDD